MATGFGTARCTHPPPETRDAALRYAGRVRTGRSRHCSGTIRRVSSPVVTRPHVSSAAFEVIVPGA